MDSDGATETNDCNRDACIVCTTPDLTGYNNITETELTVQDGFAVTATCEVGYGNAATEVVATACAENGQPYTLAGCDLGNPCAARVDDCFARYVCKSDAAAVRQCSSARGPRDAALQSSVYALVKRDQI